METFLIRALQLIISLSLLVVIHEGGHFMFARLFKTRVEKFYLFFNPWFSLFKYKPKNSETEYGIGWVPLGGYVKIAGMIDESMDTEQMEKPMESWEFRAKPAWQRLLIMLGGVLFNFLLALFIYSMILFKWGDTYIEVDKVPLGMDFNQTAKNVGFRDGDVLLSADGEKFVKYDGNMLTKLVDAKDVKVRRNGQVVDIHIPGDMMNRLLKDSVRFASFRFPFVVDSLLADGAASKMGMMKGDSIIALDGKNISFVDFKMEMNKRKKSKSENHEVTLTYMRNGMENTVTMQTDTAFNIGVVPVVNTEKLLPVMHKSYGFLASFPAGVNLGIETLKGYVSQMKHLFSKEGAKQLGGFVAIGSIFPTQWDWNQFWHITAFLSIVFAFMNILPIPALDGGHVLFLLYEIIARRKPSDKFMERAQITGLIILFALLLWANFNDVLRFIL